MYDFSPNMESDLKSLYQVTYSISSYKNIILMSRMYDCVHETKPHERNLFNAVASKPRHLASGRIHVIASVHEYNERVSRSSHTPVSNLELFKLKATRKPLMLMGAKKVMMRGDITNSFTTLSTSYALHLSPTPVPTDNLSPWLQAPHEGTNIVIHITRNNGSIGKGILIGVLSAFGSAALVVVIFAIFYFFRHTSRGRIFLDRIGRPGEYDDEQALAREEAEALESMDDLHRLEYLRAKGSRKLCLHHIHHSMLF